MSETNEWREYADGLLTVLAALTVYCRHQKEWRDDHPEILKAAENVVAAAGFPLGDDR